jgi:hypothetical protein
MHHNYVPKTLNKHPNYVFNRSTAALWYNASSTHASVPKRDATAGNLITNWGKFFVPAPVPRDFIRDLNRESIQKLDHKMKINKFQSFSQSDGIKSMAQQILNSI